ncbi:hypothetical protein ABUL39_07275 [Rhodothermus marinus]|uniref:hypothetical protein n=1 Tax=Rhodothermus marinus TaxID=29549 RepID=UPI0037C4FEB8
MRWLMWTGLWAVLLFGPGCVRTYRLTPGMPDETHRRAEQFARTYNATIQLKSGTTFTSPLLRFQGDSLITSRGRFALSEVNWIRFRRRDVGLRQGLGIGALVGAVLGGLLIRAAIQANDVEEDPNDPDPPSAAGPIMAAFYFGAGLLVVPICASIGAMAGYANGAVDIFVIEKSSPESETKKGPAQNRP